MRTFLKNARFALFAALVFASGCVVGMPYINLPWFLREVVASTVIGKEAYVELRSLGPSEAEMFIRDRTEPEALWIMRRPNTPQAVNDIRCDAFVVRTYADWQSDNAKDWFSVPQWREAFHGVSTVADVRFGFRRVRYVNLFAAVLSPGIPESAFATDGSGGLSETFFEIARSYVGAGFDRMYEVMSPFKMTLTHNETCNGFELYSWEFRK